MNLDGSEVNLNGQWLPRAEATVSVFDRGFIFGDGVYELVPAYDRKPFLADRHIDRLQASLASVGIPDPLGKQAWLELIDESAARQDFADQRIYLQVTRGPAPRLHRYPESPQPTYLLFADPLALVNEEEMQRGFAAVTEEDYRWLRGDIKSISLIAAVLASEKAAAAAATETIFLRDGMLTEGASSNVLVVTEGRLRSPAIDRKILAGVTLSFVEEIAADAGVPLSFGPIAEREMREADELMISSSGKEVAAITSLDGERVGDGQAGPVFRLLWQAYRKKVGKG